MPGGAEQEANLLERCRRGDRSAAEALVDRYGDLLLHTVQRLVGRRAVAEEIVQEAFFKMFQAIDRIDARRGAGPWLVRSAINLSRDYLKHSARREIPSDGDERTPRLFSATAADPEESAIAAEKRRHMDRILAQISPKQREIVLLHYGHGLTFPEIASALHTSIAVVQLRAFRARARIRALLEDPS